MEHAAHAAHYWQSLGAPMVLLNILPFAGLLLAIAVLPLVPSVAHWWESNRNKFIVAVLCAAAGILLYLIPTGDWGHILHVYLEYLAFVTLLGSLFIISGGIHISGAFAGLPYVNTIFMAIGALLASFLGTTGASMLLIRPLLRANRLRKRKSHIVIFFILIVSNCGGLLTPLGDPPLYLGFLRGVPFDWTFRLTGIWALVIGILLFVFHLFDEHQFDREDISTKGSLVEDVAHSAKGVHIQGWFNLSFLAGVVGTILLAGYWIYPLASARFGSDHALMLAEVAEILILAVLAWGSFLLTPRRLHQENRFTFHPILEVGALFFGIFGAMIPALILLETRAPSLPIREAWQFFWATGALSSFLDNAPTYLTFAALASGQNGLSSLHLGELASKFPHLLGAISCGAVFMGAMTYIGNGPNFMVKSIAEHSGVRMPSFGGYMLWSVSILGPVLLLTTFIFFR